MTFLVGVSIGFLWAHSGQAAARAVARKEDRLEPLGLFVASSFLLVWWLTTV